MVPIWLTTVAWIFLSVCFVCAGILAYDILVNQRRQPMSVMDVVFPITTPYFGPFALTFSWRWARAPRRATTVGGQIADGGAPRLAMADTMATAPIGAGVDEPTTDHEGFTNFSEGLTDFSGSRSLDDSPNQSDGTSLGGW
jgi:hypothetical protein